MARIVIKFAVAAFVMSAAAVGSLYWSERSVKREHAREPVDASLLVSSDPTPVLTAIESLESQSDAKCHSSASRFEDFLHGTPLSDEARQTKADAQKALVVRVWSAASRAAHHAGESSVSAQRIADRAKPLMHQHVTDDGSLHVHLPSGDELEISQRRAEQYGSIAYSLRAILAAQQDYLVFGGEPLMTLAPGAIEELQATVDVATLCALALADRDAREKNQVQIGEAAMEAAWARVAPGLQKGAPTAPRAEPADAENLALFDDLVDRKVAAYQAYNDLDADKVKALLLVNTKRFYARAPLPRDKAKRPAILFALEDALDDFASVLVAAADRAAREAGHELIRADDAVRAVQALTPHEIDDFEDVHLFSRLSDDERVTLEAYDCDSFRDFGLHWPPLQRAIRAAPTSSRTPDPFAAEILAEGISQYGVLLLRIAGQVASERSDDIRLRPEDLTPAAERIRQRARRYASAPPRAEPSEPIVSAADSGPGGDGPLWFSEVTDRSGVDFEHRSSRWLGEFRLKTVKTPPTFSGGGAAAEDVDGDGDMDLLLVGGAGNTLWINDGRGHFEDVTERAGIQVKRPDATFGEARQPIIADLDNDGVQDILITYVDDEHRVYRGLGDLRFEDVTAKAGLGGKGLVCGPATVFDFDGDGLLDLYVGCLGDYLRGDVPHFDRDNRNGTRNRLFRNQGGMRFADATEGSGSDDPGWTQAVSHVDFDRDGRQDLIVANDFGRNSFLRNLGEGRFENVAPDLGVTPAYHSMNVGVTDLNRDRHPDIYISNLATLVKDDKYVFPDVNTPHHFDLRAMSGMLIKESDVLWMSRVRDEALVAYEPSVNVERGATSTGWAWDAEFLDFDHDGDDDLYLVNGTNDYNAFSTVYRHQGEEASSTELLLTHSRESNVFFLNEGGKLKNASPRSGADFVGNSRSAAYLDLEGDGDLDMAVNNFHAPAKVFRNDAEKKGNWLKVRLIGEPGRGSNRDAIGATIELVAGPVVLVREIQGGSGYLSMNPKQQHFGLGQAQKADVRVTWPNGEQQQFTGLAANRAHTVRQGDMRRGDRAGS
jgi:hypothetical protein